MARRNLAVAIAVLLFLTPTLQAVPHLHPELYPNAKPCHPKQITQAMIKAFGSPRMAIISSATGTKKIAVILVRFPSADGTLTSGPVSGNISSVGTFDGYFTSMAAYYTEVSFNALILNFRYFGSGTPAVTSNGSATAVAAAGGYMMSHPLEYYGCGDVDSGCAGGGSAAPPGLGGAYLINEALVAARLATTGPTSTTSAGTFDAVLVMHAGYGNETTGQPGNLKNGDIWSAFYQEPSVIGAGGTTFVDGATFPELEAGGVASPLGVMCHEFGHVLTLPDLYNTAVVGGSSVVGYWELMDSGPYAGTSGSRGLNPSHMGAWDKVYLGWSTPQVASGRASFSINPIESGPSNSIIKMPVQSGGAQEYFLLEYRSKTAGTYDHQIPGTGLLIWHIDDAVTSARGFGATNPSLQNTVNIGSPHYGVSIVAADGTNISADGGRATNVYANGDRFINPKSDNFSGQPSGVGVVNITGVGGAPARFDINNSSVTVSQTIVKLINFPNPAGKGYSHPSGEGHTTIQVIFGRDPSELSMNIYTLSGDLVLKVPRSEILYNDSRTSDYKWVYEFDWDLKNGSGQHVAPGVYLILVRADGETKSAKAVVIR